MCAVALRGGVPFVVLSGGERLSVITDHFVEIHHGERYYEREKERREREINTITDKFAIEHGGKEVLGNCL